MAGLAASRFSSLREGSGADAAAAAAHNGPAPGLFELASWAFFASHLPITLLVDAQAVLPRALYSWGPRRAIELYVAWSRDPLMRLPQPPQPALAWFRSIIGAELVLQVPFFVVALLALRGAFDVRAAPPRSGGGVGLSSPPWLLTAAVAYGAHVATTLLPILATFAAFEEKGFTTGHRAALAAIYAPYLVMPLAVLWRAAAISAAGGGQLFRTGTARSKATASGRDALHGE
jgi:hypothetical protein